MSEEREIRVPDIGDFDEVEVVEILVAKGDRVEREDPLVTIESDKATMEIPSTAAGVVSAVRVSEGDRVSEGSVLIVLEDVAKAEPAEEADRAEDAESAEEAEPVKEAEPRAEAGRSAEAEEPARAPEAEAGSEAETEAEVETATETEAETEAQPEARRSLSAAAAHPVPDREGGPHASPLVRRFARELGVPIEHAEGHGPKGRILVDDVKRTVRERFTEERGAPGAAGRAGGPAMMGIPPMPEMDFASFGPVQEQKLSRIQRVSGPALHRSWLNVPHVTQHDEADVTELERFRRERQPAARERGVKLSPLLFVMKAVVVALRAQPTLRSSLASDGDRLIVKDYFHLGIAVDTEEGLVVPVIRDVDRKGIFELAEELTQTAERARARKLSQEDLRGACFTISSLGGIGGTAFSPIVNAPEVAILGLSRTRVQPLWQGPSPLDVRSEDGQGESGPEAGRFEPRLILPLSLSYDHRVVDGAEAVRFTSRLSRLLSDPLQLLL